MMKIQVLFVNKTTSNQYTTEWQWKILCRSCCEHLTGQVQFRS